MDALTVFHRYLDAWNSRRPDLIASAFASEGTYSSPAADGELVGDEIAEHARSVFATFPDLSFEIVTEMEVDHRSIAVRWRMRGTNAGPLFGGPPLRNKVDLPGAEFIQIEGDQIRSVVRYFDQKTMLEQMGLVLNAMPAHTTGPVSFGSGIRVSSGIRTQPGAFGITVLHARSDKEISEVSSLGQQVAAELLGMRGFIGFLGLTFGHLMFTVTAWEDIEAVTQILGPGAHREAVKWFFQEDVTEGGMLSVWRPERIRMMARCADCRWVSELEKNDATCERCGYPVAAHCVYF